jgi:transcriptional regulator with XRE-family HTH domain
MKGVQRVQRSLPQGKLKQIRLDQKRSQLEVATKAGISVSTLSRAERGRHFPLKTLWRICKELGIKEKDLLGDSGVGYS